MGTDHLYSEESLIAWTGEDLDGLLLWSIDRGASDILILPGDPVWVRFHGDWHPVTRQRVESSTTRILAEHIGRSASVVAAVEGGDDKDPNYEVKRDRLKRERFRVNLSATAHGLDVGVVITLRPIPGVPPTVSDLSLPDDLVKCTGWDNGLVLVTGVMGCHAPGSPMLLADGRIVPVENLAPGDCLVGPDGGARRVVALHQGMDRMYRICPGDGAEPFVVNEGHVMPVSIDGAPARDVVVGDLVMLPPQSRLAIRQVSMPDHESRHDVLGALDPARAFADGVIAGTFGSDIPPRVLVASKAYREEYLRGLVQSEIGSDIGVAPCGGIEVLLSCPSQSFMEQASCLARSLGHKVTWFPCCELDDNIVCLSLVGVERAAERLVPITIEPYGLGSFYGVELDGDRLYCAPDMIVHHNSGKSTTIAALLRHIRETRPVHIITYEDPIEFDLRSIPNAQGPLEQTEIGLHLPDFGRAPRNAGRRAPQVVLLGEMRDLDTISSGITLTEMGVLGFATLHTRTVPESPSRMTNVFPTEDQAAIATTLASTLRLIVQQRLLPSLKGGRVPIWEYMIFEAAHRNALINARREEWVGILEEFLWRDGQPLVRHAFQRMTEGHLTEGQFRMIVAERGVPDAYEEEFRL